MRVTRRVPDFAFAAIFVFGELLHNGPRAEITRHVVSWCFFFTNQREPVPFWAGVPLR